MSDLNCYAATGRLGADPELRYTSGGKAICSARVAVSLTKDDTLWLTCELWDKSGENFAELCKKGQQVALHGRLKEDSWTAQDGTKRSRIKLVVNNWNRIGGGEARPKREEVDEVPF